MSFSSPFSTTTINCYHPSYRRCRLVIISTILTPVIHHHHHQGWRGGGRFSFVFPHVTLVTSTTTINIATRVLISGGICVSALYPNCNVSSTRRPLELNLLHTFSWQFFLLSFPKSNVQNLFLTDVKATDGTSTTTAQSLDLPNTTMTKCSNYVIDYLMVNPV